MNSINVPTAPLADSSAVLMALSAELTQLTPEVRKAASYVLDNPNDVGVSSIREIAVAADAVSYTHLTLPTICSV